MQLFEQKKDNNQKKESASTKDEENSMQKVSKNGFISVLKNLDFLNLWLGQVFSQLADKIYLVLMIAIISNDFHREGEAISGWVSGIMIAFTIPAILFGSLAGVYVDRWQKKLVLVISNLGRGLLVFIIPFFVYHQTLGAGWFNLPWEFWLLLLITFFVSTLTQFFAPAEQSSIPLIVKKGNLLAANSLYTTTMMVMLIIGFAIGNPLLELVTAWGDNFSFNYGRELLVGGGYTIAGLILLLVNTREREQDRQTEENHVWEDIKGGLAYLQQNHRVRNALFQLIILFSIFAALAVLAVSVAEKIPGIDAEEFGYLLAAAGVGIAVGAAFVTQQGKFLSHGKLSFYGSMGMAIALMGLSFSTGSLPWALLMIAIVGGFAALVGVPMQTTIQAETPPDMRGKVFGLQNNAVNIALSLPLALAGIAESILGLQWVLVILALSSVGGGILTSLLTLQDN
ncbi:major facilitator superfamily MFS_1 [Cyanobacterium stanieri PCC 7202]|uniref:Major facilitator superfamily MFS_1 n=1 Tax=Cyanobacterium stanieri (strain ATCC 29140 / PCC 7202) TaxID=292563 RepID=K9YLU8_CYASC|nr:major facilitator superfamily MFS_1 [Cyanobacterium stanieri PCC 7202]